MNKPVWRYGYKSCGRDAPDREYRSEQPGILCRMTENKETGHCGTHIFREQQSGLWAGIRGVFSCLRNRDVKFRKRQKQIPDTG